MKQVIPWAYTGWKTFDTCPKKFYHEKILCEFPFQESEATLYGKEVHKACEDYITSSSPVPKKFGYIKPTLEALQRKEGVKYCELKMGLTENYEPCDFFSKDVWVRGVADLVIVDDDLAWIVDYKTSKNAKYADKNQLELMALMVWAKFQNVEEIRAGLVFLVCNEFVRATYTREHDEKRLQFKWVNRYRIMYLSELNELWSPNPNGLCKAWCPVLDCVHNGQN